MNWLIVEDEADIRNLVAMMCQVWGNTPMTYESGIKVWEWLDSIEAGTYTGVMPEFALMDIRMPGKRGNEISARIRTVAPIKHIPIVLMTAFVMSEEEMERMRREFGVDAVINKPLPDFDRLRTVLDDIIKKKHIENAKAAAEPVPTPAPASAPTPPSTVTPPAPEQAPQASSETSETPSTTDTVTPTAKPEVKAETPSPAATSAQPETPTVTDVTRPTRPTEETKQVEETKPEETNPAMDKPASDTSGSSTNTL